MTLKRFRKGFKDFLDEIGLIWLNFKDFFYEHKSLFDLFFHLLYSCIILGWVFGSYFGGDYILLISALFASLFMIIRGVEKLCDDSRNARHRKEKNVMSASYNKLDSRYTGVRKVIARFYPIKSRLSRKKVRFK